MIFKTTTKSILFFPYKFEMRLDTEIKYFLGFDIWKNCRLDDRSIMLFYQPFQIGSDKEIQYLFDFDAWNNNPVNDWALLLYSLTRLK